MTPEELAAATHAIAKADGWTEREIKSKAMGALQWQTYEIFAKAALEAVASLGGQNGPVHEDRSDSDRTRTGGDRC